MRRFIALVWGVLSAFLGILGVGPSIPAQQRPRMAQAQVIAAELPAIGLLAGLLALWHGPRAGSRRATLFGALGVALALRSWFRRTTAGQIMAGAMREGLGLNWQHAIPPEIHRRFAQQHREDMVAPLVRLLTTRTWETRDVLFAAPDGHPLRLDVVQPVGARHTETPPAPRPAVILLHGGTWFQGDKGLYGWGLQSRWLAAHGYVVFDVQYRLNGEWPAPLSDVKCAIRWVKANAERFNIDPQRVALVGRAAGAHLALMAAYTPGDARFPAGCFSGPARQVEDGVAAVVASGAPADLRLWPPDPNGAVARLLGGLPDDIPDVYEGAAPVTHIKPGLPPTLVIHGQRDRTVPPNHGELLVNRLHAADVTAVLLRVPGGRHGIDGLPVGVTGPMIQYDIDRFLAWVFYGEDEDEDA